MDNITIREYTEIKLEELLFLYEDAGWLNYTKHPQMLLKAYENSLYILAAWRDMQLVGIVRVLGDGFSMIYIQDLLVLKEVQHQGIGSRLLTEMLERYQSTYQKVLLTDNQPRTVAFYEKMGLKESMSYGCVAFVQFNSFP